MQTADKNDAQEHMAIKGPQWLVMVAAGSGGPQALAAVLPLIPANFAGTIIIFQHMRPGFTRVLADQLNHVCQLPVHEVSDGDALQSGRIILVPAATDLSIEKIDSASRCPHVLMLDNDTKISERTTTHVDKAMASVARVFGKHTVGVLLTGIGSDGCAGLREIAQAGGVTLVQDEDTSVVHDLPASAVDAGVPVEVLPLWSIADRITEIVTGDKKRRRCLRPNLAICS